MERENVTTKLEKIKDDNFYRSATKKHVEKYNKNKKIKQPTIEEASVQIYKIQLIQWIKLRKTDRNYIEDANSEIVGDIVITTNGVIEECIELARRQYPNAIITNVMIYDPKKEEQIVK